MFVIAILTVSPWFTSMACGVIVERTRTTFAVTFEPCRVTPASFTSQIASGCLFSSFG